MPSLSTLQRTAPPIDRWHARRGEAAGGVQVARPRTLAPGLDTEQTRFPGTVFDTEIVRDRGPSYQVPHYTPPAVTWISWTAAGPTRPELHMRNATLRTMVGNSESRYPVVDTPTTGLHSMGPAGTERTASRYQVTPQMIAPRQFRLRPGQYAQQTYSQTTRVQGGGRK